MTYCMDDWYQAEGSSDVLMPRALCHQYPDAECPWPDARAIRFDLASRTVVNRVIGRC
jgi:hypothetical protein